MVVTKKSFTELAQMRQQKKKSRVSVSYPNRIKRLALKDGIPKYFWEFQVKYELGVEKLKILHEDKTVLDTFLDRLKYRGRAMFNKLFQYKPDAHFEVVYGRNDPGPFGLVREIEYKPTVWAEYAPEEPYYVKERTEAESMVFNKEIIEDCVVAQVYEFSEKKSEVHVDCLDWTTKVTRCQSAPMAIKLYFAGKLFFCKKFQEKDFKQLRQWIRDLTVDGLESNPGPTKIKRKEKKKNKNRKKRTTIDAFWSALYGAPPVPRSLMLDNATMPFMHKTLSFTKTGVMFNGASSFLVVEFKPNDMYDPEAAVTGGQPSAFNALMTLYNYFVVRRFKIEFTVNNLEVDFSANCYTTFKDAQPTSTITTYAAAEQSSRIIPATKLLTLPPNNSMPRKISTPWMDVRTVVGSGLAVTGLGFVGAANASPAQVIWSALVVYSPDAATFFGVGVDYTFSVTYDATLFSMRTNVTLEPALKELWKEITPEVPGRKPPEVKEEKEKEKKKSKK